MENSSNILNLQIDNNFQGLIDESLPQFYLFLDFDGVLNDLTSIPSLYKIGGFFVKKDDKNTFTKNTIPALNFLISALSTQYNVNIVLSTTWRRNFAKAVSILENNGLKYHGEYYVTPHIWFKKRSEEIETFIKKHNVDKNKFVVLDDKKHLSKHFDSDCIHTNIINGCLTISDVMNYIDTKHPQIAKSHKIVDDFGIIE